MKARGAGAALVVLVAVAAFPAIARAGKLYYTDTLPRNGSRRVSVTVKKAAAFRILMRTSTQGRTRLYLLGAHAPKGGPLIDTKTYHCDGAAGSWYCKGSYEALPPGTYTFRVVFSSSAPTNPGGLELTVNW
jgi:hypothetical protein